MNKTVNVEKTVDIMNSHDAIENILKFFTEMPQEKAFHLGIHNNFCSKYDMEIIKINS